MAININRANRLVGGLALVIMAIIAAACGSPLQEPSADPSLAPASSGAPRPFLIHEDAYYYQQGVSVQDAAQLANDLEFVGSTTESNKLAPGQSLDLYRPAGAQTSEVYTLEEGQTFLNEDGRTITIQPEWVRWTVSDNGLPAFTSASQ